MNSGRMSATLRTTKHLIKWLSRVGCHDTRLLYIGFRRISASLPWISPSHIMKRAVLFNQHNTVNRYYASDSNLPAHKKVPLPALSPTMERGTIVSWEKKEGDRLNEGDLLAEIETDKATMGFETPEEGYLAKIVIPGGTKDVPIGKIVCIIVESEDDLAAFKNYVASGDEAVTKTTPSSSVSPPLKAEKQPATATVQDKPHPQFVESISPTGSTAQSSSGRVFASPFARKIASDKGIDLKMISKGTGPDGRIRAEDVLNYKSDKFETAATFQNLPLALIYQENSKQILEWKKKVPHYYLTVEVKMDNIFKLKSELNLSLAEDAKRLTDTDFVIKASALACQRVPETNSSWQDTHIRRYNTVNINVVHHTNTGVYTPVIRSVESKGLGNINKELSQLKTKVLDGTLQSQDLEGGTFTINNLEIYKIRHFSQVIYWPQSCALSIGSSKAHYLPNESNPESRTIANIMCATLSCDHRVVDGAVGAQWLDIFKRLLEKPHLMLM